MEADCKLTEATMKRGDISAAVEMVLEPLLLLKPIGRRLAVMRQKRMMQRLQLQYNLPSGSHQSFL